MARGRQIRDSALQHGGNMGAPSGSFWRHYMYEAFLLHWLLSMACCKAKILSFAERCKPKLVYELVHVRLCPNFLKLQSVD